MKKLFTLLLITLTAFTFKLKAQNTNCNAGFDFTVSGLSVKFTASLTTDPNINHHYWKFGDGSISSDTTPVHTYAAAGTYTVKHIMYKSGSLNGIAVCIDSIEKKIVINNPPAPVVCNLHPKFSFERDPSQPNKVKFTNLSAPINDTSKAKWSFGDGGYSTDFTTSHIYANSGLYLVCLSVQNNICIRDTCMYVQIQLPPAPCNLVQANFVSYADSIQNNKIHFTNLTLHFEYGDSILWTFGDGSSSTDANPTHIYAAPGTYKVCIRIQKRNSAGTTPCVKEICKEVVVEKECRLQAKFSFERDASQPNKIKFTNLSTPASDIHFTKWNFGDGTYSNDFNATHVYANSGLYTVCLIVQKDNTCQRDTCAKVQVHVPPPLCSLQANFAWHADSIQLNKVHFINISSHFEREDKIRWSFGDGTSSYDGSPTHIYSSPGTYNVCIRIEKHNTAAGIAPCVKEICKQVVVVNECRVEANFSFEADATNKNKIYFKNTSTPATAVISIQWNFGDGTTSNSINPDHIYAHAGVYNVCLKISGSSTCYREICKKVEIKEPEINCLDISKFTLIRSTANCLEFKFTPVVQNPNWKYVWSFGDGTGSTDITPSHVFPRSGNYTVFLTVYRSATCVSTSYKMAETGACFSCNNIWAKYEYKRESITSNKIYFHALSNYPVISQTWVITRLSINTSAPVTLIQNNPYYVFNEPGDYRVCLRAVTYGGCVKEYCEVIHISSPNAACTLTAFPNPTTNQISVNVQLTQPEIIHVYLYNSLNILLKQKDQKGNTGNNLVTTNIESLIPGWYTIKVIYGNRVCYSKFQKI
ncbi:MAG: PKD domain-containing protein [Chitinophagaceae bacterium]